MAIMTELRKSIQPGEIVGRDWDFIDDWEEMKFFGNVENKLLKYSPFTFVNDRISIAYISFSVV